MIVYVVNETATFPYDEHQYHTIYGVYATQEQALAAAEDCRNQVGGDYYASIEEHPVAGAVDQ